MVEIPMNATVKALPFDCWEAIFSFLSNEDLKAVSLTCKDYLAYSNSLKKSLRVVHPEISMLSRHLNRFRNLKSIDLFDFQGNRDEAIREIACSGIRLETLDPASFPKSRCLGEEFCLSKLFSNLKACSFIQQLRDSDLADIVDNCPNLEVLMSESDPVNEITRGLGSELLVSKLRLLKQIHLYSSSVCDQFIAALSLNCVFLKDVTISSWDAYGKQRGGVTENAVAQLLKNRPNLEALLIDCMVKNDSVSVSRSSLITIEDSISRAKALTSFVIGGMSNTDKVLMAIAKAKLRLNELGLVSCKDLTVFGLISVLSDHLKKLRIDGTGFTDGDMELLLKGHVGKLTHIEINRCNVSESTPFLLLSRCSSLVDIRMMHTNLDERVQDVPLSKNHKIQSLGLENCYQIDGKLVKQLVRFLPNLKVLNLSGSFLVTTKDIQAILKRCKHVTELNLAYFSGAKMIEEGDSEFPELNLEVLKLSFSSIDDEGLAVIAKKCPRLVSLHMNGCNDITTEGMKQVVKSIKTLKCLNVMRSWNNNFGALLEWMLSTGNFASLKQIFLLYFTKEERDQFLQRGCLLSKDGIIMHLEDLLAA